MELIPIPKEAQLNFNHAAPVDWSMFLLLFDCLFSFLSCRRGSFFDLHMMSWTEEVEVEAMEKQLTV